MGIIFTVIFSIASLTIGLVGIVAGIIGIIIAKKRRKANKPFSKPLTVLSSVALSIGAFIALIPVGFFSFIVIVNSVPPEGFVETEIVIEENGYQDTRFTADGTVYEALELELYNIDAIGAPIFSYKTSGFLNGSQCGNYYAVENSQGFHLVTDDMGTLFCPTDEKESVIKYYSDISNLCGYYDDWDEREHKLSDEENKAIQAILEADLSSNPKETVILNDAEIFEIKLVCKEGVIHASGHWFLVLNDTLYYVHDSVKTEDDTLKYTVIKLPSDIAEPLLEIHKNG